MQSYLKYIAHREKFLKTLNVMPYSRQSWFCNPSRNHILHDLCKHLLLSSFFFNYSNMSSFAGRLIALQWFVDSQDLLYIYDVFVKFIIRKALSWRLLSARSSFRCYFSGFIGYASLVLCWSYFQNNRLVSPQIQPISFFKEVNFLKVWPHISWRFLRIRSSHQKHSY